MYSSEGSGDFTERTYNFKTRDLNHEGPISATEIIDIAPEGEGWRFVVQKRQYNHRYKIAEDCPSPILIIIMMPLRMHFLS